jgi:hypothetical protein
MGFRKISRDLKLAAMEYFLLTPSLTVCRLAGDLFIVSSIFGSLKEMLSFMLSVFAAGGTTQDMDYFHCVRFFTSAFALNTMSPFQALGSSHPTPTTVVIITLLPTLIKSRRTCHKI